MAGNWTAYRLDYRAESPVHIGWHRLGQIRRTRYFIPARNVWGAWTAAWTRRADGPGFSECANPYKKAEEELKRWTRFTALFPWTSAEGLLRPTYGKAGLRFGELTAGAFEARFVHGFASASIDPNSFTALDGALHEREYLHAPGMRFHGYVLVEQACEWHQLRKQVERLQIGGNIGYGYGMLRLAGIQAETQLFDEFAVDTEGRLTGKPDCCLAGFCDAAGLEAEGEIEIVSGRGSRRESGAGQDVRQPKAMWTPGSRVPSGGTFEIGARGDWLKV